MNDIDNLYIDITTQLNTAIGSITVDLAGVQCKISGKDAIGHLVQEWLFHWCTKNQFFIKKNIQTQTFPDFFMNDSSGNIRFLEIKSFHLKACPSFDVADFYSFIETLPDSIEKLYADYLVFGYKLNSSGNLTIPKTWKLKIWEIVGSSEKNYVTCQIRGKEIEAGIDIKGRIQKLRPYDFRDINSTKKFTSPLAFLEKLQLLLDRNRDTHERGYSNWLVRVKKAYYIKYNKKLI